MLFNLKIIMRNFQRGGVYSVINIGGLAIGMAAAILILAWIYHEWSFDRFHVKGKQLYVVYERGMYNGVLGCSDWTPKILAPTLKENYPEIAGVTRMSINNSFLFTYNDSRIKIQTCYTDPDFFTMFDFPLLYGNFETALNDPYSVILTEKAAIRLFGRENPMGKSVQVNNQYPMTVTGVMKDLPGNTLFNFEALTPVPFMKIQGFYDEVWLNFTLRTYVELQPNIRLDLVNETIRDIINEHSVNTAQTELFLSPLSKRHLYTKYENGMPVGGLIDTIRLFGVIAGLILLIACINFMNLSTARSGKRAKEVGVRKMMGSNRLSLIGLFLGEATLIVLIASIIALALALITLPVFSSLMKQPLSLNLTNGWFWLTGLGFILITGLLAGSYPAFYLSSFSPVKVLKDIFRRKQGIVSTRKVLVVLQFTVAVALIVSTLVVHRQIGYAQDRESGYDKEQLVYITFDSDLYKNYELIKHDLLNSGTALSVTKTSGPMTKKWGGTWLVDWKGKIDPNGKTLFEMFSIDADWTRTVNTTIIEGRDIDIYTYPTDSTAMLLNETAVNSMNFEHPIGEIVKTGDKEWHVVGVVKDFVLVSPYSLISPMIIFGPVDLMLSTMHIKFNNQNRMKDNLAQAEQIFRQYNPAYPFEYQFVDEEYARKFGEEQKIGTLSAWFACLTILISCLGLYALIAYLSETRRKEIGIRKVLGASVSGIMFLLSKEFLVLVLISIAIASPVAWLAMTKWLANFAYRTNIPWWLFVVVGCISLCIALLTVGFQAGKAATANPVKSIKAE